MQHGVQTDAACNIQQCCVRLHRALEVVDYSLCSVKHELPHCVQINTGLIREIESGVKFET